MRHPRLGPTHDTKRSALLRVLSVVSLVGALVLVVSACGDDSGSATASTAKASTATTVKDRGVATTSSTVAPTRRGSVEMRIGDQTIALTAESCTNHNGTSIELSATDGSGNTLKVDATDGSGSAVLRGPSQDREGTVRSVQVAADGTFSVAGIVSTADDSAPAPDDFSISGLCA